ncbi:MAG: hypothetical protein ACK2UO_02140 [Caldilineaceae bacterium]
MAAAGMIVPAIESRPSLVGFGWLWEAYQALSTCRAIGMSVGPIPWSAVQLYADAHRLSEEEAWLLHRVVRHMDEVYLDHVHSKAKAKAK